MPALFALGLRAAFGLLGACLLVSAAQASSFVTVAPPAQKLSSSFVAIGEAPPKVARTAAHRPPASQARNEGPLVISRSVVAFGALDVEDFKVAAIPKAKRKAYGRHAALPTVVRGGVAGGAFAPPPFSDEPPVEESPTDEQLAAEAAREQSAEPTRDGTEQPAPGGPAPGGPALGNPG